MSKTLLYDSKHCVGVINSEVSVSHLHNPKKVISHLVSSNVKFLIIQTLLLCVRVCSTWSMQKNSIMERLKDDQSKGKEHILN